MDEFNDVRMALGALSRNVVTVNEKLDDQGAQLARLAELADTLSDVGDVITEKLPAALRALAHDPMLGMMIGAQAAELADTIERAMVERRQRRQSAPQIERR